MNSFLRRHLSAWFTSAFSLIVAGCAAPTSHQASAPVSPVKAHANAAQSDDGTQAAALDNSDAATLVYDDGFNFSTANADIWQRIRSGFLMDDLNNDIAQDRTQWYAARPDYLLRMTERSRRYLYYIVDEINRRQMPTELALLPFVESAFDPQAVSSAKAAGMWQFIPSTGRDYSLQQNMFRDERRDIIASTNAALDYLQRLHDMFGDWQLALAAYNWGEGNVQRAIARNEAAGLPTNYASLSMPLETRYYVPKLQAIKNIVRDPLRYQAELPLIPNHPFFQAVAIEKDIDVAKAAQLAEVPLSEFKALNPAANKPVILAEGAARILLPWDNAATFIRNLRSYTGQLASWTAWTAPKTMSISAVAAETGMSETELRTINRVPPHMLVKAGSTLLVTRAAHITSNVAGDIADHATIAFAPAVPPVKRVLVAVKRRDTIATIARRYSVAAASVAQWNKLSARSSLKSGVKLVVYLPEQKADAIVAAAESAAAEPASPAKARVATASRAKADGPERGSKSLRATTTKLAATKASSKTRTAVASVAKPAAAAKTRVASSGKTSVKPATRVASKVAVGGNSRSHVRVASNP